MPAHHVAIIGAGLSGLALALALKKQSIPCTIYEARSASLDIGGAIMLSPNALRVLDAVGIYQSIKQLGFQFTQLHFYTDKPLDTYEFGNAQKYGFDALRIYRHELINALIAVAREKGIQIDSSYRLAPELDREGWNNLLNDKQWCLDFLREGVEDFSEIVQSAVSNMPLDKINLWPFYVVLKLDTWTSKHSRVVLLGDSAHAIPPTAGQGVNQAFEDVYTYALVLAKSQQNLERGLKIWQQGRQERVDRVLDLNARIDS